MEVPLRPLKPRVICFVLNALILIVCCVWMWIGIRWSHLFATDDVLLPLRPNWKSLCKPAILPLTTDYMPPAIQLKNDYFEYNYNVQLVRNENHYQNVTESLLREMICQRLAQDYQNIVR